MKLTIFTNEFKNALSKVVRIVPSKSSLPVLENVLFNANGGFLYLSSTDLELALRVRLVVKAEGSATLTVPGKHLNDYVSALESDQLEMEIKDDTLTLVTEASKASFSGIDAKEYPELPLAGEGAKVSLPVSVFEELSARVTLASSIDINRPTLTGVLIRPSQSNLDFVATDGYRLSMLSTPYDQTFPSELLIPSRFINEAAKLLGSSAEAVDLSYSTDKSVVILTSADFELSSKLIEGTFPNYEAIIPSAFVSRAVLSEEDLSKALRLVGVFAKDTGNIVKVKFLVGKNLELTSNASQVGSSKVSVAASVEGEDIDIAFNIRYLTDFVGSLKASQLIIEASGKVKPALFAEVGNPTFKHIIMPVKMQD